MDSQSKLVMLITLILFSFFLLQSPSPISASPVTCLLKNICDKTTNPKFCMKTFNSDPRTSKSTNYVTLAKISLDLAIKDSIKTQNHINGLIQSKSTKPIFKPALKQCLGYYKQTAGSFRSAYSEVEVGEYQTANYDALIAADDAGYCKKALASAKANIKSVSQRIQITRYFSSIGDRVTLILWNSSLLHPIEHEFDLHVS